MNPELNGRPGIIDQRLRQVELRTQVGWVASEAVGSKVMKDFVQIFETALLRRGARRNQKQWVWRYRARNARMMQNRVYEQLLL